MAIIEAAQLSKTYANGVAALKHVDLQVEAGEVFGLLGPNGAGKTTAVRVLNGTLQPTGGTYRILGESNGSAAIRQKTATLSEQAAMYTQLSVRENLLFFADMYGIERGTALGRIQYYLKRMELWERRNDKLGTLSTGQKKRIQIARSPARPLAPAAVHGAVGYLLQTLYLHRTITLLEFFVIRFGRFFRILGHPHTNAVFLFQRPFNPLYRGCFEIQPAIGAAFLIQKFFQVLDIHPADLLTVNQHHIRLFSILRHTLCSLVHIITAIRGRGEFFCIPPGSSPRFCGTHC